MMDLLTWLVFGPEVERAARRDDVPAAQIVAAGEHPRSDTSSVVLNEQVARVTTEWIALADAATRPAVSECERAVSQATDDAVVLFVPRGSRLAGIWQRFPAALAGRIGSLSAVPLMTRRATFDEVGPFAEQCDAVWEWVLRALDGERNVVAVETELTPHMAAAGADGLRELVPRPPESAERWLASYLESCDLAAILPAAASVERTALKAGLFQIHDFLDASHELAQSIEGEGRHRNGDYWHAIMHRREPDASNAKYWLRRVGRHPVFGPLAARAEEILRNAGSATRPWEQRLIGRGEWDPFAFVDLSEQCRLSSDPILSQCTRHIQQTEMDLLLEQCLADATA